MLFHTGRSHELKGPPFEKVLRNYALTVETLRLGRAVSLEIEPDGITVAGFTLADVNGRALATAFLNGRARRVVVEQTFTEESARGFVRVLIEASGGVPLEIALGTAGVDGVRVASTLRC